MAKKKLTSILLVGLAISISAVFAQANLSRTSRYEGFSQKHGSAFAKSAAKPTGKYAIRQRRYSEAGESVTLHGIVVGSSGYSLCSFPATSSATFTTEFSDSRLNATGGAVMADGKLYVNNLEVTMTDKTATQYVFDADTWKLEDTRSITPSACATVMAYDETTDKIYGQFYDDGLSELYWGTMDETTGRSNVAYSMDDQLYMLAAAPNGDLYAVTGDGLLETVDKKTGKQIKSIGNTGLRPKYLQSGTFDKRSGKLYWAYVSEDGMSGLYEVDPNTAVVTLVAVFSGGEQVVGMYTNGPKADDNAPAQVADLGVNFSEGSLTGTVDFTAPDKTYGGSVIDGQITAYVEVGDKQTVKTVAPGEKCSIPASVDAKGYCKVAVYTENSAGRSPRAKQTLWLGNDEPQRVDTVLLDVNNGKATIRWDAPKTGRHGGYVDPGRVVYDIVRWPAGKVVAENYSSTSFTEDVDNSTMQKLYYSVTPIFDNSRGRYAYSNEIVTGAGYEVPVKLDFNWNENDFSFCKVVDANNDGTTWTWNLCAQYEGNNENSADDWLITAGINLKADRLYYFSYGMKARNGGVYPEVYDIKIGQGQSVEAMTNSIVDKGVITTGLYDPLEMIKKTVRVDADGSYNIGFHAASEAGFHKMMLYKLEMIEGPLLVAPDSVANLSVKAAEKGVLKSCISFNAPEKEISGKAIDAVGKIEVYRDEELIKTFDKVKAGTALSLEDDGAKQGNNSYRVVAYDSDGNAGLDCSRTVFCGVDVPDAPLNVRLTFDNDHAKLTWDAPKTGANGGYVNPDELTYYIYDDYEGNWGNVVAGDVNGTSFEEDIQHESEQNTLSYVVYACSKAGKSAGTKSNIVITGDNYTLPFSEPFPNGGRSYVMWITGEPTGDTEWDISKIEGHGTKDGCAVYEGSKGCNQALVTGKLSLKDAKNPVLSFWYYAYPKKNCKIVVEASELYDGVYTPVGTVDYSLSDNEGWTKKDISLKQFTDLDHIHLAFHAYTYEDNAAIFIDDIQVRDILDNDLEASAIASSAERVKVGSSSSDIVVSVANDGKNAVKGSEYTVNLYNGNSLQESANGKDIASNEVVDFNFKYVPEAADPNVTSLYAVVDYSADENLNNNTSKKVYVKVEKPKMPVPTALSGQRLPNSTVLTWNAPDLTQRKSESVTEDFESYDAFIIDGMGDWTMYDKDGGYTCNIQGYYFKNNYQPMAYIVFNSEKTTPAMFWTAHSGSQFLVSFASDAGTNDDWLVSPELSGEAQTISFWAKSANNTYGLEEFEVLYSTTDKESDSFKTLTPKPVVVPCEDWTSYEYELPEGAKYFAIRCVSPYRFALLLDDITFDKAAEPIVVKLAGYNVYRNGIKVNGEPVADTRFVDNFDGDAQYYVTAVYDLGESERSNVFDNTLSAVEGIKYEGTVSTGKVYDLAGRQIDRSPVNKIFIKGGKKFVRRK